MSSYSHDTPVPNNNAVNTPLRFADSVRISRDFLCDALLGGDAVRVGCYLYMVRRWGWSDESVACTLGMSVEDVHCAVQELADAGWAKIHADGTVALCYEISSGMPPTHEWDQWQTDIAQEQWRREQFYELVDEIIEVVRPIDGGWGDERNAAITAYVQQELLRAFPPRPDWRTERRRNKAKISNSLRTAVYERDEYACVVCGVRKNLSVDHIIPESKGGPTTLENCQTMCQSHNSQKGAR